MEFVFRGSQMIKSKKLLLRIIGYLEIIFPGIQVDKHACGLYLEVTKRLTRIISAIWNFR